MLCRLLSITVSKKFMKNNLKSDGNIAYKLFIIILQCIGCHVPNYLGAKSKSRFNL